MAKDLFYCLGSLISHTRWIVIVLTLFLMLLGLPFVTQLTQPFKGIEFKDKGSESAKATELLDKKIGYNYNRFIVMYTTPQSFSSHPEYITEIKNSLAGLKKFPLKYKVIYPALPKQQISSDKHAAYAAVSFSDSHEFSPKLLAHFKSLIKQPKNLTMRIGGEPAFLEDTKVQTQKDLFKTEYISAPISLITMIIVFGSIIAGFLPIVLGGVTVFFILLILFFLAQFFDLSVFTINIALLVGLCLSLDYSLLIISRFKDELRKNESPRKALAITQMTAGKAVFFSGLAVFVSLSALLFFPINVLFSVGVGGLVSVLVAVTNALILLPACLSIINYRINWLSIHSLKDFGEHKSFWYKSVKKVEKRPWFFFITILILLLILGYPFLHAKISISDFRILPKSLESRQVFDVFKNKFGENKLQPILLILQTKDNTNILTNKNIGTIYQFSNRLAKDDRIKEISSIVNTDPRSTKEQYQMLYTKGKSTWSAQLKDYLEMTTRKNLTVMTVISNEAANSTHNTELIEHLRDLNPGKNLQLQITGTYVNELDVKNSIWKVFPFAVAWILGFTYLILLILLRSVVLPLKAIITTILSLTASYGVLVLVFQEGYLHGFLNFEPQGIVDITLMIIIFCALFGISMDYEVFLLSRIKEFYEKTGNTAESIILGIARSSKIISSAAIIIIFLCFAFMAADVVIVKAFGLGIAVAVFVDAFIIRILFVPATMQLLGKLNWYAPKWLKAILPEIEFDPE